MVEAKIAPEDLTEQQKEYMEYLKNKRAEKRAARGWTEKTEEEREDKSFFHGKVAPHARAATSLCNASVMRQVKLFCFFMRISKQS